MVLQICRDNRACLFFLNMRSTSCSAYQSRTMELSFSRLCLTLCDPMDCSTPGSSVLHYLLEFVQTHVH